MSDIKITLGAPPHISVSLDEVSTLAVDLGGVTVCPEVVEMDIYDGEYIVVPSTEPQTLATTKKYLERNIEVKEVPFYEVSNTAGGITAIIGG